jgi:GT2 family glycosyltransferase
MYKVCICVLNYNNGLGTVNCLESIFNQTNKNYSIVIIDNKSSDDSVAIISNYLLNRSSSFQEIESISYENNLTLVDEELNIFLIKSSKNTGYSCGNNIGIRFANASKAFSHILIINNDLVLNSFFLENMFETYKGLKSKNNQVSIALGAIEYNLEGKITHQGFHYLNLTTALVTNKPIFPSFSYLVGSCIFLETNAPLMDESYFLYFDDAQYSKTLKDNGWLLSTCKKSSYIHEVGYNKNKSDDMDRIIFESMRNFYQKNFPHYYPFVIAFRVTLSLIMGRFKQALLIGKSAIR